MGVFEGLVIFVITWWLAFLPILSSGTNSQAESGAIEPGTDPAAPVAAGLPRKVMIATGVAATATIFAYIGMQLGWFSFLLPPSMRAP